MSRFSFLFWFNPVRAACHANGDGLIRNFFTALNILPLYSAPSFKLFCLYFRSCVATPGFSYQSLLLSSEWSVSGEMCFVYHTAVHCKSEGRRKRPCVSQCSAITQSPPCLLLRVSLLFLLGFAGMLITSAPDANVCSAHMFKRRGKCMQSLSETHKHTSDVCVCTGVIWFFSF